MIWLDNQERLEILVNVDLKDLKGLLAVQVAVDKRVSLVPMESVFLVLQENVVNRAKKVFRGFLDDLVELVRKANVAPLVNKETESALDKIDYFLS